MNRTWWKHLQIIAPNALRASTERFAKKFPKDWRIRIQKIEELEQYFYEMYKLELHQSQVSGGALPFGFRISGRAWKVSRNRHYSSADEARWAGLSMAFSLVEAEGRQVVYVKPQVHQPVRRQVKDEKKSMPKVGWKNS
jgi:hypothetical protein